MDKETLIKVVLGVVALFFGVKGLTIVINYYEAPTVYSETRPIPPSSTSPAGDEARRRYADWGAPGSRQETPEEYNARRAEEIYGRRDNIAPGQLPPGFGWKK